MLIQFKNLCNKTCKLKNDKLTKTDKTYKNCQSKNSANLQDRSYNSINCHSIKNQFGNVAKVIGILILWHSSRLFTYCMMYYRYQTSLASIYAVRLKIDEFCACTTKIDDVLQW